MKKEGFGNEGGGIPQKMGKWRNYEFPHQTKNPYFRNFQKFLPNGICTVHTLLKGCHLKAYKMNKATLVRIVCDKDNPQRKDKTMKNYIIKIKVSINLELMHQV